MMKVGACWRNCIFRLITVLSTCSSTVLTVGGHKVANSALD